MTELGSAKSAGSLEDRRVLWRDLGPSEVVCSGDRVMGPDLKWVEATRHVGCLARDCPPAQRQCISRDTARLDFLEAAHRALNAGNSTYEWELIINENVVRAVAGNCFPSNQLPGIDLHDQACGHRVVPTCRQAIDAKMQSGS